MAAIKAAAALAKNKEEGPPAEVPASRSTSLPAAKGKSLKSMLGLGSKGKTIPLGSERAPTTISRRSRKSNASAAEEQDRAQVSYFPLGALQKIARSGLRPVHGKVSLAHTF